MISTSMAGNLIHKGQYTNDICDKLHIKEITIRNEGLQKE